MPICSKCGCDKPDTEFYIRKRSGMRRADCKACVRARNKLWDAAHPEKVAVYKAAYASKPAAKQAKKLRAALYAGTENRKRSAAAYVNSNRAAVYARNRAWFAANPHKRVEYKVQRRCAEAYRAPKWHAEFDVFVAAEAVDLCARRFVTTGFRWDTDHIIPLRGKRVSGLHVWNNLRVMPRVENCRKSNFYDPFNEADHYVFGIPTGR